MQLVGSAEPDRPWAVGISDPIDRTVVRTVVTGTDLAVATSGTAERGAHIVDPSGRPDRCEIRSATVIGPSLTRADAGMTYVNRMRRASRARHHWYCYARRYSCCCHRGTDLIG